MKRVHRAGELTRTNPNIIAWLSILLFILLLSAANRALPFAGASMSTYTFADASPESPFRQYAERLHLMGVIQGVPCGGIDRPCDDESRPYLGTGAEVRRGELAQMLVLARKIAASTAKQELADVPPEHPFFKWARLATGNHLMQSFPCGAPNEPCGAGRLPYFRPDKPLTRADLADVLELNTPPTLVPRIGLFRQSFEDVPPTHASWKAIEQVVALNLMTGYSCIGCAGSTPCVAPNNRAYFLPTNKVTRGQVVKAIALWLDRTRGK